MESPEFFQSPTSIATYRCTPTPTKKMPSDKGSLGFNKMTGLLSSGAKRILPKNKEKESNKKDKDIVIPTSKITAATPILSAKKKHNPKAQGHYMNTTEASR